jgi:DNA topoisomerase-1
MKSHVSKPADLLRDGKAAARAAMLEYADPNGPGIERRRVKGAFVYFDAKGRRVRDRARLTRIQALVIPPAWERVWICPSAHGHIQATGVDAKGRKQYRYHSQWRALRDQAKYEDILPFVRGLPRLRQRVERDMRRHGLDKNKVIATIVQIMERTQIRVGNEKYAQSNHSYGLTTLRDQHAHVNGAKVEFKFRGKSGKIIHATIRDKRLAAAVKRCRDIPGQILFQYIDEHGNNHPVTSTDVNAYIRETMGQAFTAKEFRTWAGTLLACAHLLGCEPCRSQNAGKKVLVRAAEVVSAQLGNTVAVCRKCYIDPLVFNCYLEGNLRERLRSFLAHVRPVPTLSPLEAAVARFLESLRTQRPPRLAPLARTHPVQGRPAKERRSDMRSAA